MQVLSAELQRFTKREYDQGRRLRRALRGRYQDVYRHPERQLERIRKSRRFELKATNPYARAPWLRTLAAHLCQELGAVGPTWVAQRPVYFVTLIDDKTRIPEDDVDNFASRARSLRQAVAMYRRQLSRLSFIGMLDIAPYVSAKRVLGEQHVFFPHFHALVWAISRSALRRRIEQLRSRIRCLVPGTTSVYCSRVNPDDLLQMIWYMSKSPRKQYQIWPTTSGRYRQAKREINGVNSCRVHRFLGYMQLTELVAAGGRGEEILTRVKCDVRQRG